jgi:hypothetical protein
MSMPGSKRGLYERAQRAEQRGNRDVRDLWDRYGEHRARVTAEILTLTPGAGGRLCLLGAGNANDVDLDALAARFDEIHLVDVDPAALARATGRQSPAVRARLRSHAPVDLSGLYRQLDRPRIPGADTLVAAGAAEVLQQLPSGFTVVASCCLLTQMSWALEHLGPEAPLPFLQQVLVRIHLRTIAGLVAPDGAALLVNDLASSTAYPLDELGPGDDLQGIADRLAFEGRAYPVCNPTLLRLLLRRDSELAVWQPPRLGAPWLWAGPNQLTYLVYPAVLRLGQPADAGASKA